MGYQAASLGPFDLALPAKQIQEAAHKAGITLVVTPSPDRGKEPAAAVRIVNAGTVRVALIGALSPRAGEGADGLIEQIARVAHRVRPSVDLVVVLSQMSPDEVERCAKEAADVDLFLSGRHDIDLTAPGRLANAAVLPCSLYGQSIGVAEVHLRPRGGVEKLTLAFHRVDAALAPDPPMAKSVSDFYKKYAVITPLQTRTGATERVLAGILEADDKTKASCQSCHEREYESWKQTRHAHAWETLVGKGAAARSDCISCHTTQELTLGGLTAGMSGVSCATCHGGDPDHARFPHDPRFIVRRPAEAVCTGCHTALQSPHFSYRAFLARVDHSPDPSGRPHADPSVP